MARHQETLKEDIELNREFASRDEEVLLSLLFTQQLLERLSHLFLQEFELTATQFNALMIIRDYETDGIHQSDLARRLIINRASSGTLIDKLVQRELVERRAVPGDRRAYHLVLTPAARKLLRRLLPPYYDRVQTAFGTATATDKNRTLRFLDTFRENLKAQIADLEISEPSKARDRA